MAHESDRRVLPLGLAALGVVFGDIGTSPLYAMRETLSPGHRIPVTPENVVGVASLVFWSLVVVIAIKYVTFVMRADNHGEGGILALTALIMPRERTGRTRRWLVLLGLFGTALLYGDGAITPAISVLSAVEGLEVVTPGLESYIIPIAIAILVGLFAIQHRGTGTVGALFGPVMIVWFLTLAVLGARHIPDAPEVLMALDPRHAIGFFADNTWRAFVALGSVFLVVTGGEALYADMGHFGVRPIRLDWFALVMPALVVHYLGQAAFLMTEPGAIEAPFFLMAPQWALVPLVILATLATIIASQALISGVFSLTVQAVQLGYSPRVQVDHTSEEERGQVYLPAINWTLMAACIGLVIGFGTSADLAAAYGVAVTATMAITTLLFGVFAREHWGWSPGLVWTLVGVFLVVDLGFFGANLLKIPSGGWFPLVAGMVVFVLLTTWKTGRGLVHARLARGEQPLRDVVANIATGNVRRTDGTAVFMTPNRGEVPSAFLANLRHNHVVHDRVVFLTIETGSRPHIPHAAREEIEELEAGFHLVTLRYGFMDHPDVPGALAALVGTDVTFDPDHTTYFLGRESIKVTELPGMMMWRERLFRLLHRNATSAADYFGLPPGHTVEIGIPVEI